MREILFRGKRVDNGEWVHGGFWLNTSLVTTTIPHIIDSDGITHEVDPATVGQFTGLTDKNDNKIFEGDIIKFWSQLYDVRYNEKKGCFLGHRSHMRLECWDDLQLLCNGLVISNVFDE